jgi:serine/threonine kinase PknH
MENLESFDARLLALLPRGYDDGVCEPVHPPLMGALATVDCGAATPAGGPTSARYSMFADQPTMDKAFDQIIAAFTPMVRCPGSELDSPTTWHYTETPDTVAGRIACGTYKELSGVTWTKNAELLMGDSLGQNIGDLHNWWLKYG